MGFSVMLWGAEKLVPAEYWCPYGTFFPMQENTLLSIKLISKHIYKWDHFSVWKPPCVDQYFTWLWFPAYLKMYIYGVCTKHKHVY